MDIIFLKMKLITIAICTYNRTKFLELCINSIANQNHFSDDIEVLIIDNNSTEDISSVVNKYQSLIPNLRVVIERKAGLSNARNRAIIESEGEWIAYIDDDTLLFQNYIEIALKVLKESDFDAFGGNIYSKYLNKKPKWIKEDFEGYTKYFDKIERIYNSSIVFGGNMIINKSLLNEIGGFNENLGMKFGNIGYGEETELIKKFIELNYKVGFVPDLSVYHHVLPYKLKLIWQLKSFYKKGIAWERINDLKKSALIMIIHIIWNILKKTIKLPFNLIKLLKKDYYWQNLILDFFDSIFFNFGRLKVKLKI